MNGRHILLITIDRLGASYLGPYGNTWLETRSFNRLAAESQLFENGLAESIDPRSFVHSILCGRHAISSSHQFDSGLPLLDDLHKEGMSTIFLTDDAMLADEYATGFDRVIAMEPSRNDGEAASSWEQSHIFDAFASLRAVMEETTDPAWVWLHTRSFDEAWDAPIEFRQALHDEDDPDPWTDLRPPRGSLDDDHDPDELFQRCMAYGAQVMLLDHCLGWFVDGMKSMPQWKDTPLALTSVRGYPLGEHKMLGDVGQRLYGELVRVPVLLRTPGGSPGIRHSAIIQPHQLSSIIRQWAQADKPDSKTPDSSNSILHWPIFESGPTIRFGVCQHEDQSSIRTPAWYYMRQGERKELFVKPDDLWEVNEVADRCADIARELDELLSRSIAHLQTHDDLSGLYELPDHLTRTMMQ